MVERVAAVASAAFTVVLLPHAVGDWPRLITLLLCCLALVWLFACSSVYHIVSWSPSTRPPMRQNPAPVRRAARSAVDPAPLHATRPSRKAA